MTSVIEEQAEQSVKPEALALGLFGLIAGVAVLLIAAQAIARLVSGLSVDRRCSAHWAPIRPTPSSTA